MATHSPMLMAYPNATLLRLTKYGLEPVTVKDTDHYKVMREFCDDARTGLWKRRWRSEAVGWVEPRVRPLGRPDDKLRETHHFKK